MTGFRTAGGGRIDRSRPVAFTFDGRRLTGFAGDTLASALIANGIHLVGRSFKYHRPRGILAAGAEEPNALVTVDRGGGRETPNLRATQVEIFEGLVAHSQNRWPSLKFDVGAVADLLSPFLSAGFYYKTFMWPPSFWARLYEPAIRRTAGLGKAPKSPDPDRYLSRYAHCDVLVVGGRSRRPRRGAGGGGDRGTGHPLRRADRAWRNAASRSAGACRRHAGRRLARRRGRRTRRDGECQAAAAHHRLRLFRGEFSRPRRTGDRPPRQPRCRACRANASGRCGRARWCSRPARSSGRWSSPGTTGPASCSPTPPAPSSTATASRRERGRSSRPIAIPPIARRSICIGPALPSPPSPISARGPAARMSPRCGPPGSGCCRQPRSAAPAGGCRIDGAALGPLAGEEEASGSPATCC